jgi:hypothetical protein
MKTIESLQRSQNYDEPMTLFKRLPRLRWKRSEAQEIIPPDVQTQCPELGTDFKLLAEELMPHFRKLDANALQLQNEFRLEQVLLIFSAALASARPKRMGSINVTRISCQ